MNAQLKALPEIGKKYHFFDDGKIGSSRHYIAECVEIISAEEAKNRFFVLQDEDEQIGTESDIIELSMYDIWKDEAENHKYLYAQETDCFVGCIIPKYDDNIIWFARTTDGGWFSINIQSWWQSGRLI